MILCIYCDVIEHVPELAEESLLKISIKSILQYANGEGLESSQACVFIFGFVAWRYPELFQKYFVAKDILVLLFQIFHGMDVMIQEQGYIKDNCVVSAYRIISMCFVS